MRCFWLTTAFWAIAGLVLAVLVVGFGLYNVSAKQGHLPGVAWLLHTTYHNSVELRAPPESAVPDLASPDLVALGAKHYDSACRFCHAAPSERQSQTVSGMEPPPPHINDAIDHWEPRHLFWIVRNGVKMSGMPPWPSKKRGDDVWAIVAFLEAARNMGGDRYRALISASSMAGISSLPARAAYCAACHEADGASVNTHIPRLDIQNADYLRSSLEAYRIGTRYSGIMQHAASGLEDEEIAALADHFASAETGSSARQNEPRDQELVERGRALATGTAEEGVAACAACHGPWQAPRSKKYPSLLGQHEAYLLHQLRLWKSGRRGDSELSHLMHKVVPDLTEEQMRALAAYYASEPPAASGATR